MRLSLQSYFDLGHSLGLGDEAFYTNASGLSVRKGDKGIAVSGLPLDKAKEFAKKALGNL